MTESMSEPKPLTQDELCVYQNMVEAHLSPEPWNATMSECKRFLATIAALTETVRLGDAEHDAARSMYDVDAGGYDRWYAAHKAYRANRAGAKTEGGE